MKKKEYEERQKIWDEKTPGITLKPGDALYRRRPRVHAPQAIEDDLGGTQGRTKKEFGPQVNINTIMRKAIQQGALPQAPPSKFGDFSGVRTYLDAHQALLEADDLFMSLPAPFRKELNNSPAEYIAFTKDPKNRKRMVQMGLAEPLARAPSPTPSPAAPKEPEIKKKENPQGGND